jgi:hypothetical protein
MITHPASFVAPITLPSSLPPDSNLSGASHKQYGSKAQLGCLKAVPSCAPIPTHGARRAASIVGLADAFFNLFPAKGAVRRLVKKASWASEGSSDGNCRRRPEQARAPAVLLFQRYEIACACVCRPIATSIGRVISGSHAGGLVRENGALADVLEQNLKVAGEAA